MKPRLYASAALAALTGAILAAEPASAQSTGSAAAADGAAPQDSGLGDIIVTAQKREQRLLNSLVRPEQLVRFREDIILPSVDRWMSRMVRQDAAGAYGCDLAGVVELIFLEFAAKIIGIEGVESEEGMARLRGWRYQPRLDDRGLCR